MKMKAMLKLMTLVAALAVTSQLAFSQQQPDGGGAKKQQSGFFEKVFGQDAKTKKKTSKGETAASSSTRSGRLEPDDTTSLPSDVPAEIQANRRGLMSEEESAVVPYYNNFMMTYRLGPEDVISVSVFGQPNYSKANIIVPPDGRISYPLIPDGIFVGGKTTIQIQDELAKKLDEYIIDPKVTVSLDQAKSARYSVLGDVGQPGIKTLTRRVSVYEAIAEAGGVLNTGDKSKVFILRRQTDGNLRPIFVNIKDIERGRAKEMAYLIPGDQVVVPGNRLKTYQQVIGFASVLSFARLFLGF
ncbi:MAG TPA: polysaccharide biosynthesis/export family protein [Pyrinomonadaceae bacterium]|jgi:polysaccharide export outer membrane protein